MNDESDNLIQNASTIIRGASLFGAGRVLSHLLGFFSNLLLTQALGVAGYGVYIYGSRIISVSSIFAQLGAGNALLRYIPKYEDDHRYRNQIFGLVIISSVVGSILLSISLYIAAPTINSFTLQKQLFVRVLRILAIILPFNTLTSIATSTFRALELLEYQVAIVNFIHPVFRIVAIGIAVLIGAAIIGVVAATIVAAAIATLVAFVLLLSRTSIRPLAGVSMEIATDYFSYSLPLTATRTGSLIYNQIDIFMVGFFLTSTAVGVYGIAVVIAGLLVLPLTAVNQLFPSIASDLYTRDAHNELQDIYQTTTRWSFTVSLFLTVAVIVYRRELLHLFGEDFVAGAIVLSLFAVGKLTNSAVGPSGFVLLMTDHQYINLGNQWAAGILNVVLNYIFILRFGITGAAMGTMISETVLNLTRIGAVWWLERLHPYSWQFLKPIAAGITAGSVMYGLKYVLNDIQLLVFGSMVGALVFLALLFFFGLEKTDYQLLHKVVIKISKIL